MGLSPTAFYARQPQASRGFTVIELMVVVAILAILSTLAAPSFRPLLERWRVQTAVEGLQSSLYFARSEAVKRGGSVAISKAPNNLSGCSTPSTSEWDCGWVVCEDKNNDGACANSEPVLQRVDAPSNLEITRTSNGANVSFNRWGGIAGSFLGFSFVPKTKATTDPAARGLCVSSGGRIRTIKPDQIPCTG